MSYTYVSPRGIKTNITEHDVQEGYRTLILAGYSMIEASEQALDYVIHQINFDEIPLTDLLYSTHTQQVSLAFCSAIANKLAYNHTKKMPNEYTT